MRIVLMVALALIMFANSSEAQLVVHPEAKLKRLGTPEPEDRVELCGDYIVLDATDTSPKPTKLFVMTEEKVDDGKSVLRPFALERILVEVEISSDPDPTLEVLRYINGRVRLIIRMSREQLDKATCLPPLHSI